MDFTEKTLSTKRVYNGKVVFVDYDDIETSDGYKSFREVIRHPGGVVIVAQKDENTILHIIIDIRFTGILIHVIINAHAASKHITNIYELNISFTIFILLSFFLIIDTAAIATINAIT